MMVNIIEQSCISKNGNDLCNEDGIFVSGAYIAVIDGATSKDGKKYQGKSGGQCIRDIIMESLSKLNGYETFQEAVYCIQSQIEKQFPCDEFFPASASATIYNIIRHQAWFVGDCQALIGKQLYDNRKQVDLVLSKARAVAIHSLLESGDHTVQALLEDDLGRAAILPLLKLQMNLENTNGSFGYLVFNNRCMPKEVFMEKGIKVDVPRGSEIVLASDGYPVLCPTLKETEEKLVVLLKTDPLCYKQNMGTKGIVKGNRSFDDRTYVRFTT